MKQFVHNRAPSKLCRLPEQIRSVFFSAVYSAKGHSRDLLLMAAREEITLVVSQLVIDETRRNISELSLSG
jgi:predicted nucleic acid-binding protein